MTPDALSQKYLVCNQICALTLTSSSLLCLGFCIFISQLYLKQQSPTLVLLLSSAATQITTATTKSGKPQVQLSIQAPSYHCKELVGKKTTEF